MGPERARVARPSRASPLPLRARANKPSGIPEASDYEILFSTLLLPLSPPHVLLAGYSFGALAASICAPPAGVRTSYLLLSYPLSVLWALTGFRASPFVRGLEEGVKRGRTTGERWLVVWGDEDQFTGVERLREWGGRLREMGGGGVEVLEVEGADHFWGARGRKRGMMEGVMRWLEEGMENRVAGDGM